MATDWINSEYFPGTNYTCPPQDALAENCVLYRFGSSESITDKDFVPVTSRQTFRDQNLDNYELLCQASGLSSFRNLEDTKAHFDRIAKKSPGLKKKFKSYTRITLSTDDGVVLETPSNNSRNHLTWWGYKNKIQEYISNSEIIEMIN